MHVFLGFTIGEWGNFITIATVCAGLFTWIIRVALVNPLQNSIQELTSQIRDLKKYLKSLKKVTPLWLLNWIVSPAIP